MSHRGDKKERTALMAAFLLFAAALFVVGPAEASRTTTNARSSLAPSPSLELPSLELVETTVPVESSPRFGFGEDLGMLDPEAGPGGFVLFAAEAARCELIYAANNPLKYVDPDGRAVVVPYERNERAREDTARTILSSSLPGRDVLAGIAEMLGPPTSRDEVGDPFMSIGPMPIGVSVSGRALFALGREGEALAGSIGSKVRIPSFTGAKFRIPDGLTVEALSEVKNSAYVRFTGELKDFLPCPPFVKTFLAGEIRRAVESWRAVEGRREAFASLNAPGSAFHRPWKTAVDSRGPSGTLTRRGFPQLPTALSSSLPVGAVMPLSGGLA